MALAAGARTVTYRAGWVDGVEATLRQLEVRARGGRLELDGETRDWIAAVRARLDQEKARTE